MDRIQATPRVNPTIGGLADLLAASYSPQRTQQLQGLMNFLGVPAVAQTLDRLSYGEPITTGRGMTTELRDEAKSTLGALLGLVPIGRAAAPAAEAATMAAGRAGERVAERAVPRIMQGGGLPAEMLGAFGQNTQSRIFIGPEARTWDKDAAFRAARMEKQGATPEEIWAATGTARGPDKMWRQEIDDSAAKLRDYQFTPKEAFNNAMLRSAVGEGSHERALSMRPYADMTKKQLEAEYSRTGGEIVEAALSGDREKALQLSRQRSGLDNILSAMTQRDYGPMSSYMRHPELAQAYPDVYKMHTRIAEDIAPARGRYMPETTGVGEQINLAEMPRFSENKSTMLHELQHAIQERERFAVGGSARNFAKMRRDALEQIGALNDQMTALVRQMDAPTTTAAQKAELKQQYDNLMSQRMALVPNAQIDPMQAYGHLMGEAEARLVQRRMNLTPEQRRQNFPFQYTGDTGLGFDVDPTKMILMTPEGQILERGLLGSIGR